MMMRAEIWTANLNPSKGTEPGKTRPVVIWQAQELIDAGHLSTIIIPLSTQLIDEAAPLRFRVEARDKLLQTSDILVDQIRAIDKRRLVHGPLTRLNSIEQSELAEYLSEVMGS